MSYDVDIIRGSTTYSVSDGDPFYALTLTGIGLPPVRLLKERGSQQHGSTVVGHLLDERLLNLALLIKTASEELADDARDLLAEIVKPIDGVPCIIRVTRADGSQRQLDAYTVGSVDFPNTRQERFAGTQLVVAQFEAPDPIFYDPTLNNIIFDISDNVSGLEIPFVVPALYANTTILDAVETITYAGKRETFPIIYVVGPANDLVITNETTGKVLDFTGTNIASGVTYAIDLRYGYKTITDNNGTRQNAALTDDSDLVDWSLVPSPTATDGINDIRVEIASGLSAATLIRIEYYDRYPSA